MKDSSTAANDAQLGPELADPGHDLVSQLLPNLGGRLSCGLNMDALTLRQRGGNSFIDCGSVRPSFERVF